MAKNVQVKKSSFWGPRSEGKEDFVCPMDTPPQPASLDQSKQSRAQPAERNGEGNGAVASPRAKGPGGMGGGEMRKDDEVGF